MANEISNRYVAEYPKLAPELPGQNLPWLQQLRKDALASFSVTGFPSPREEEWRYTNISAIEKKLFSPVLRQAKTALDARHTEHVMSLRLADAWSVVLINGHFSAEFSVLDDLPAGVQLMGLTDALNKQSALIETYLGQSVSHQEHSLVAFNTAWFGDGVFVNIPTKHVLSKPIQILHVVTEKDAVAATRTVIVLGEQAEAQVIESFVGFDHAYLTAAVTEVLLKLTRI